MSMDHSTMHDAKDSHDCPCADTEPCNMTTATASSLFFVNDSTVLNDLRQIVLYIIDQPALYGKSVSPAHRPPISA